MVKIDIISGFLGAGKTTLIKKLLKEAFEGEQVVLIENEFGEIGIDGGFLKDAGIEIREMNSGCICCSLVGDFGASLKEVVEKYHPDRILIEPSGVGKLSDVIKAVQGVEEDVDIQLNSYTTVVDAKKCKMYMKNFGEFFDNQIQYAGAIIMSRTDIATEKKVQESLELLRSLNKDAAIITTPIENLDGKKLVEVMEHPISLEQEMLEEEHEHHHHHHDHDADEVFTSWGHETAHKYSHDELESILTTLDSGEYGAVLRAKGIVDGGDTWYEFDMVPGEHEIRPCGPDVTGKLCVIGSQLKEHEIAELFHV